MGEEKRQWKLLGLRYRDFEDRKLADQWFEDFDGDTSGTTIRQLAGHSPIALTRSFVLVEWVHLNLMSLLREEQEACFSFA